MLLNTTISDSFKYKKSLLKAVFVSTLLVSSNSSYADEECMDLGPANKANVFVQHMTRLKNTEVTGRLFSGGSTWLQNFGVGTALIEEDYPGSVLIAGDDADNDTLGWENGQAFNGDVVHAGKAHLKHVNLLNGHVIQDSPIDFEESGEFLQDLSKNLAMLPSNGDTWGMPAGPGQIILYVRGHDPELNVFNVSGESLKKAVTLRVQAPETSTVIINVEGIYNAEIDHTVNRMEFMGIHLEGPDRTRVLYNFPEAEELSLEGIGVQGTVLAPFAHVKFNNGQIDGKLIAYKLTGTGEAHEVDFVGCLPIN